MNDNKDLKNLSHDTPETPGKQKKACAFFNKPKAVLKTIGTWFARMFMGASRTIEKDEKNTEQSNGNESEVEKIVSPGKQAVKNFFRRPLAVVALCVVVGMFLFVFIGPLCMPTYRDDYTSTTQANLKPTLLCVRYLRN